MLPIIAAGAPTGRVAILILGDIAFNGNSSRHATDPDLC
jgi:hypothetical protein